MTGHPCANVVSTDLGPTALTTSQDRIGQGEVRRLKRQVPWATPTWQPIARGIPLPPDVIQQSTPPEEMCGTMATQTSTDLGPTPGPGEWAVDTACGVVGRVREARDSIVLLEPVNGGRTWQADPEHVRRASVDDRLRAGVRDANARTARTTE